MAMIPVIETDPGIGDWTRVVMLTSLSEVSGHRYDKGDLIPADDFEGKPIDSAILVLKVADLHKRKES